MISDFERQQYLAYVSNAMERVRTSATKARRLFDWCNGNSDTLGIDIDGSDLENIGGIRSTKWRAVWAALERATAKARRDVVRARPSRLANNIDALADFFNFDSLEVQIFAFGVHCAMESAIAELANSLDDGSSLGTVTAIAMVLGVKPNEVASRLTRKGRLLESGLVKLGSFTHRFDENSWRFSAPSRLVNCLAQAEQDDVETLLSTIIGAPARADLEWDDFEHLGEQRQFTADLLRGALDGRETGINILLYGPPGTGKTEFCKVIAGHLGTKLFLVGEADEDGDEPERTERVAQLRLAQQVLSRRENALLLFDEMEDLLGSADDRASKIFGNRLLEQARVPTLWTCNDLGAFDPALLRRMTMAIEVRTPSPIIRERVWRRNLAGCPIEISDADVRSLAREPSASPALAANAVRATRLAGGGADRLRLSVNSIAKAMRGGLEKATSDLATQTFDIGLANADTDLVRLSDRLARAEAPRNFSLCLSGPPGTGKSAYVRHLAERMGMEVLEKRASDLLGMFVGESEKNIAEAFAEARESRLLLIFDEADSLLTDRTTAHQSWEVSQVNEMLTWMERHPMPFACTTNLMARLDPASLRRFTIKAGFNYLRPRQAEAAFMRFFALPAPSALTELSALTPGDFAVVARKAEILDDLGNVTALLDMLRAECAAKPNAPRPIGFR